MPISPKLASGWTFSDPPEIRSLAAPGQPSGVPTGASHITGAPSPSSGRVPTRSQRIREPEQQRHAPGSSPGPGSAPSSTRGASGTGTDAPPSPSPRPSLTPPGPPRSPFPAACAPKTHRHAAFRPPRHPIGDHLPLPRAPVPRVCVHHLPCGRSCACVRSV